MAEEETKQYSNTEIVFAGGASDPDNDFASLNFGHLSKAANGDGGEESKVGHETTVNPLFAAG